MKKTAMSFFILLFCLSLGVSAQAAPLLVKTVRTEVKLAEKQPTKQVTAKINLSLQKVSEKLLKGQDVSLVAANQQYLEETIAEVFKKVLLGYEVVAVKITPGKTAHVLLQIQPVGETVEVVKLVVDIADLSPQMTEIIEKQTSLLEEKIGVFMLGLPAETSDWSESALEPLFESLIARKLPGFQIKVDFQWGRETQIILHLKPETPVIKQVRTSIRAANIPRILLETWRRKLEKEAEVITGLPVAFVAAYLPQIQKLALAELEQNSLLERYGLSVKPQISIGEITQVDLIVYSSKYNVELEGSISLGSDAPENSELKAHLGYYVGKKQEFYLEPVFYPNPVTMDIKVGYDYLFDRRDKLGYVYNLSKKEHNLVYQHHFVEGRIKVEYNLTNEDLLLSYRYPLNEYLSVEAFSDLEGKNWFALTADL